MNDEPAASLAKLKAWQATLQQQEREIVERRYIRRIDGFESIRNATRRLSRLGSAGGMLARAAEEFGTNSKFDRILISEVNHGLLSPRVLWERDNKNPPLPAAIELSYPMVEHELTQHRGAAAQIVSESTTRTPRQLSLRFNWASYGVGAIVADGRVIGLLHADADLSDRLLDEVDHEIILLSCAGLGDLFERTALRETLQRHRVELQAASTWLGTRLHTTGDPLRTTVAGATQRGEQVPVDSLTPREHEILSLLARGRTNRQIASSLLIQEGTVKYHVKNLLRKLGARSRADAVARFARATGSTPR